MQSAGGWEPVRSGKNKDLFTTDNDEWNFWAQGSDLHNLNALHSQAIAFDPEPSYTTCFDLPGTSASAGQQGYSEARAALDALNLGFLMDDIPDIGDDELEWTQSGIVDSHSTSDVDDVNLLLNTPTAEEAAENRESFLEYFGLKEIPAVPMTKRSLDELLGAIDAGGDVWHFSLDERREVVRVLASEAKKALDADNMVAFEGLIRRHEDTRIKMEEASDNVSKDPVRVAKPRFESLFSRTSTSWVLQPMVSVMSRGKLTIGAAKLGSVMKASIVA